MPDNSGSSFMAFLVMNLAAPSAYCRRLKLPHYWCVSSPTFNLPVVQDNEWSKMDDIASNTNNTGPSNINSMGKHNLTVSWNIVGVEMSVVDATFRMTFSACPCALL
ncbi:unnamed protein product [Citrullus colocynthis]|uniref:Uncharacterized protein n=1 Tax=Citrullus colocynthis TaxID=252529 RepID=A0ABP0YF35_9ROSI